MAGGRPTDFKPEFCKLAYNYCRLGAIDDQLAGFFGVCVATINNWKQDYPEFLESIKKGKDIADCDITESLFNGAKGYSRAEQKVFVNKGVETIVPVDVFYPGLPTSQIFWLKNRRPDLWRDRQEIAHSGAIAHADMDEDQLDRRLDELQRRLEQSTEN